jgi:serine/threonine protein kinase
VAVKCIPKRKLHDLEREALMAELDALRVLRDEGHPGIVKVLDVFEDTQKIEVVMECIEGGSLYQWIKVNQRASEAEVRIIFWQVCQVIEVIHSRGIAHRDIKLENILISYIDPRGVKDLSTL